MQSYGKLLASLGKTAPERSDISPLMCSMNAQSPPTRLNLFTNDETMHILMFLFLLYSGK